MESLTLRQMVTKLSTLTEKLNVSDRELERVNRQLDKQNHIMRNMCDILPEMLWTKDAEGKYLFANRTHCNFVLNATIDEVVGKTDMFFANRERATHPNDKSYHTFGKLCSESDAQVLATGQPFRDVVRGFLKGKYVTVEVRKYPLINEGVIIGVVGSVKDITGILRRWTDSPDVQLEQLANGLR